jgi:RimJ/RimL family protein N-acetyltransferase
MTEPAYPDTARLRYRLLSQADESLYCDLYSNSEVMKYVGPPLSREQALRGFKKALSLVQQPFGWRITTIVERASGQGVGISVIRLVDEKARRAEVGSILSPDAQKQGYGPEYSAALIDYAFKHRGVEELSAQVVDGNAANEAMLTKLGFSPGATSAVVGGVSRRTWTLTRKNWAAKA